MEKKIEFKRKIEKKLYEWNNDPNKVPLIVDGLRQIGKSYIVDKLGIEFLIIVSTSRLPSNIFLSDLLCLKSYTITFSYSSLSIS